MSKTHTKVFDVVIERAGKIIRKSLPSVTSIYENSVRDKLLSMWKDNRHPQPSLPLSGQGPGDSKSHFWLLVPGILVEPGAVFPGPGAIL